MHRLRRWFVPVALLLVLAAVAGCGVRGKRATEPLPPPVGEGVLPAPGNLKFTLTVTPRRFAVGERVTFEASMFNESKEVFERDCPNDCVWDYDVVAADGTHIGPRRDCIPTETELKLEGGELRMIIRNWNRKEGYFGAGGSVAPGRYVINAGFVDETGKVQPMAEPAIVEVLPAR